MNQLGKRDLVEGVPFLTFVKDKPCSACEKGKHGLVNIQSLIGRKYSLVTIDELSHYTWVFFLRMKSDATDEIIVFIKRMENLNDTKVKELRSDNGTEFRNSTQKDFFAEHGISQNFSSVRI